jgi:hypothetical protein
MSFAMNAGLRQPAQYLIEQNQHPASIESDLIDFFTDDDQCG